MKKWMIILVLGLVAAAYAEEGKPKERWMAYMKATVEGEGKVFQEQWFSERFDTLDTNNNGFLEPAEETDEAKRAALTAAAAKKAADQAAAQGSPKEKWMAYMKHAVEKDGKKFDQAWFEKRFAELDKNNNGILEDSERPTQKTAAQAGTQGSPKATWMAYMKNDCEKKGQTFNEKWFSERFDSLDKNNDGFLQDSERPK